MDRLGPDWRVEELAERGSIGLGGFGCGGLRSLLGERVEVLAESGLAEGVLRCAQAKARGHGEWNGVCFGCVGISGCQCPPVEML